MRFIEAATYTVDHAWGALDIAEINSAIVSLHWTDQPYVWHVNDGPEVFVVLDGAVDMHYRQAGHELRINLEAGAGAIGGRDLVFATSGAEQSICKPRLATSAW